MLEYSTCTSNRDRATCRGANPEAEASRSRGGAYLRCCTTSTGTWLGDYITKQPWHHLNKKARSRLLSSSVP